MRWHDKWVERSLSYIIVRLITKPHDGVHNQTICILQTVFNVFID